METKITEEKFIEEFERYKNVANVVAKKFINRYPTFYSLGLNIDDAKSIARVAVCYFIKNNPHLLGGSHGGLVNRWAHFALFSVFSKALPMSYGRYNRVKGDEEKIKQAKKRIITTSLSGVEVIEKVYNDPTETSPRESCERKSDIEWLAECFINLEQEDKSILKNTVLRDLCSAEYSRGAGLPAYSVRRRKNKALQNLRKNFVRDNPSITY